MLAVISDLHFEEEASDAILAADGRPALYFSRNTPARVYRDFFATLASEAARQDAESLRPVLAGDIFDLHRTSMWFEAPDVGTRPYVAADGVSPKLEAKIMTILRAIASEPEVSGALDSLRLLARGRYLAGEEGEREERDFPVPVSLAYLPGNHDRLANSTPAIRDEIRRLLGVAAGSGPDAQGAAFARSLLLEDPRALVRHGHEYDRFNFSADLTEGLCKKKEIPPRLPESLYDAPTLGDFLTVEIASRLPREFRRYHTDAAILRSELLSAVYLKLLEFDDLRPQSALLEFLLSGTGTRTRRAEVWAALEPVAKRLLERVGDRPFLREQLGELGKPWRPDAADAIRAVLDLKVWRLGLPLPVARLLSRLLAGEGAEGPQWFAARESALREGLARFVIAGHTHDPGVKLFASGSDGRGERYYLDTGTWRNVVPSTPDRDAFGRLRSLTYAVVYSSEEDRDGRGSAKSESLDYRSGFTRKFG